MSSISKSDEKIEGEIMKIIKAEPVDYDEILLMKEYENVIDSPSCQPVQVQTITPMASCEEFLDDTATKVKKQPLVLSHNTTQYQHSANKIEKHYFKALPLHSRIHNSDAMTSEVMRNYCEKTSKTRHHQQQASITLPLSTPQLSGLRQSPTFSGNLSRTTLVTNNTAPSSQSLHQHVRVIRDSRLYDEGFSSNHHSVSPPLAHYSQQTHENATQSGQCSPIGPSIGRSSPSDRSVLLSNSPPVPESHSFSIVEQNQHQQIHQQKDMTNLSKFKKNQSTANVKKLPPPSPLPPNTSSLHARKYVITSPRPMNVISSNVHCQQPHSCNQQQQKLILFQHHKNPTNNHLNHCQQPSSTSQPSSYDTELTAIISVSNTSHIFRTSVVSSSSGQCYTSASHLTKTSISSSNNNSQTSMRPPPPPPPKIKNAFTSLDGSSSVNQKTSNIESGENDIDHGMSEEPTSSIPDLEFDGTTVLCRVCGDKASGFHYGVHSCEGCKGFFRRSIQQKIQYRPCTKNQQCSILRINRNRCQYCRLKKCIAVGMSRDAVRFGRVPKREKARILAAMQQSTQNRGQQRALATELDDQPRLLSAVLRAHLDTCEFTKEKVLDMRQKARDCPSFSMPTLLACPLNPAPELQSEQEFSQRFAHIIRGVIDFAGMIPGFQLLTQDDKFTLLKAGLFDALFVRLICMFDSSINSIICLNGQVMRRDAIQNGANARFLVDSTFNFAERINSMNLSDAEIGLFCAIVLITPDRPGLRNIELVEKMYSRLKSCLQTIINKNRPDQPDFIIKLLDTMPDLRTLSTLHTEKLVVFRTEHKEMLRQQMWSIDDESLASNSKSPPALSTSALSSSWIGDEMDVQLEVMSVSDMTSTYNRPKSQLGYVSSTAGDIEGYTTKKDDALHSHNAVPHISEQHFPFMSRCTQQQQPSASTLASSAPLLAATLSSGSNMHSQPRNRANSGSSGDSASSDLDLIVVSHAHLTQNGLTITPIARSAPQQVQQMHHHLTGATTVNRYRKLDSPTDSGIESGNEKNECGGKAASSGGSSSCSSPRSSVDDASDCPETNAILSSTARCMQPVSLSSVPVTSIALYSPQNALKRQIVEDMPVLKRVLQAPPLYDTNSLMDEAYKPHKKFRAMRHREFETTEADASCSTSSIHSLEPATIITTQFSREKTPPPVIPATPSVPSESPNANGHLQVHMPHPHALNQTSSSSFLSSTHSVLAKSLLAEPHMTPEQIKRSDIIQNYIMRENSPSASAGSTTPSRLGTHSPNTTPHPTVVGDSFTSQLPHEFPQNHCLKHHKPTSINQSNTSNFSHALIESPLAPPVRWKTPTSHSHVHNGIGLTSVITTSTNTNQLLGNNKHPQYTKSPTLALSLVELQVNIADSQQPLNLSKKSPSPPPSNLQTLVAAATTVQQQHHQQQKRYTPTGPTVIFEDMSTPTSSSLVMVAQATADISPFASQVSPTSTPPPSLHHKVLLEA